MTPEKVLSQKSKCEKHLKLLSPFYKDVAKVIADVYGIPKWAIFAVSRAHTIVDARKSMIYILKSKKVGDLALIGAVCCVSPQDHTTIIHAMQKVNDLKETDYIFREKLNSIIAQTKGMTPDRLAGGTGLIAPSIPAFVIAAISGRFKVA